MSKKLAIAMFGQKRLSREGGVEIVVKELCTRMALNGCDVTCYNRAGHHVSGAEYDDAGKTEYEGIRQKSVPTIERRGYVGLSIATLLSQHHQVTAVDIIPEKVDMINNRKSPIQDDYIEKYLAEKELNLTATLDAKAAYSDADFVVIAAPTNYDSKTQHFDTSAVEAVIKLVMEYNPNAIMVIKSTIPVGYTASVREKFNSKNIIFSPEFLRESKALYDNLYPSRIIVGTDLADERLVEAAHEFAGGICKMDEQSNLTEVVETKNIVKTATGAEADGMAVDVNSLVSMNMWGLTPEFLDVLEEGFKEFFEKEVPGNPLKAEYLIPIFIGELLEQGKMSVMAETFQFIFTIQRKIFNLF